LLFVFLPAYNRASAVAFHDLPEMTARLSPAKPEL